MVIHWLARTAFPAALAALVTAPLTAQEEPDGRPARLFRADEPVVLWLSADFRTVFRDRDSMSTKRYPATLRYLDARGDTVSLNVQLATRGHFRLRSSVCAFPPLKVHFDKEQTRGGLFGGEGALKLTTHCRNGERFEENVFVEYAINRMYNRLTPVSLFARLATVTWVDPERPSFTVTTPAFFTEDEDGTAKRLRGKVLMQIGGTASQMDPWQMAVTDVFQYLIGNTDFSLMMLHNFRIIQTDTSTQYYPMTYDFDWAGLVDAPYARPDYRLPIKRVTDRLYRGACHPPELLEPVLARFRAEREGFTAILRDLPGLRPERRTEALAYLNEFYEVINEPRAVRREFGRVC